MHHILSLDKPWSVIKEKLIFSQQIFVFKVKKLAPLVLQSLTSRCSVYQRGVWLQTRMMKIWTNGRKSLQIPAAHPTSTGQRAVKLRKWKRKVLKRRRKSQRNQKSQKRRKRGAITHRLHQKVTDNLPCVIKKLWRLVIFFLLRLVEILPSLSIVMQIVKKWNYASKSNTLRCKQPSLNETWNTFSLLLGRWHIVGIFL